MKKALSQYDWDAVYLAKDLIDKDFINHFKLPLLAAKVGINEHKLQYGFKVLTRCTVHEYLRQLRLKQAKRLLAGNKHSIKECAYQSGFREISSFNRAFKKSSGLTPSEWQKMILEKNNNPPDDDF